MLDESFTSTASPKVIPRIFQPPEFNRPGVTLIWMVTIMPVNPSLWSHEFPVFAVKKQSYLGGSYYSYVFSTTAIGLATLWNNPRKNRKNFSWFTDLNWVISYILILGQNYHRINRLLVLVSPYVCLFLWNPILCCAISPYSLLFQLFLFGFCLNISMFFDGEILMFGLFLNVGKYPCQIHHPFLDWWFESP